MRIKSVGYVIQETPRTITIAGNFCDDYHSGAPFGAITVVLKNCIVKRRNIKI